MSKTLTKLHVGIGGDASGLGHAFKGALEELHGFAEKAHHIGESLIEFAGIGAAFEIGREAIHGLGEALKESFETADKIEEATVAFTGLAGSAENAEAIMGDLRGLSTKGIFNLDDLTSASRKLLAVGISADQLDDIFKNIGDVSAGTGGSLQEIADVFVKVASEGMVSEKVLKSLAHQGIPVVAELATHFNTTADGVREMAKAGTIGFSDLEAAFEAMSGPGGKFAGLMEQQSQTVGGTLKRLKSALSLDLSDIAIQIGEAFDFKGILDSVMAELPAITAFITNAIQVVSPYVREVVHGIGEMAANAWGYIRANWQNIADFTGTALSAVYNTFVDVFTAISSAASTIWTDISSLWAEGSNDLLGKSGAANKGVADDSEEMSLSFGMLGAKVKEVFSNIGVYIRTLPESFTVALTSIQSTWKNFQVWIAKNSLQSTPQWVKQAQDEANAAAGAYQAAKDEFDQAAANILIEHEKNAKAIKDIVGKIFGGIFKPGELKLPTFDKPDPIKFDAMISPENLTVGITPEIHKAKLLRFGSGEAQLAQYSAGMPDLKATGKAATAPIVSQVHSLFEGAISSEQKPETHSIFEGAIHDEDPVVHRGYEPLAPPMPQRDDRKTAANDPFKSAADDIAWLRRLFTKWDTNPPLAAANF